MADFFKMTSFNKALNTTKIDNIQNNKAISKQQEQQKSQNEKQEFTQVTISINSRKIEEKSKIDNIKIDQNLNYSSSFHKMEVKQIENKNIKTYQSIANM